MTADPLLGAQLANYRLERLLGCGGMAWVYYARDVRLNRAAAVKVIDTRYRGQPAYAQRFLQEARTMAAWRHENILQVYYADDQDGLYFYAMEYIDGQNLAEVLAQYRERGELISHAEVLRAGRSIASALDYAHERGVIHRDVKPSNIFVARGGRVVLGDFGLALDVQQGSLGEVFGTANYIAPEQAQRSSAAVPASDLYSLGVVLYEMLCGQLPFDDPSPPALAIQHITLPPPSPRRLNPALNAQTEAVLLRALSKRPEDRFATGHQLMEALEAALVSGPSPADDTLPPPSLGLSEMTLAQSVDLYPPTLAPAAPSAYSPNPDYAAPAYAPPQSPTGARANSAGGPSALLLMGLGGALILSLACVVAGLMLRASGIWDSAPPTIAQTTSAAQITQAAAGAETPAAPRPLEEPAATQATAPGEPTAPPQAAGPAPTVMYPDGKRFILFYNESSFYILNASETNVSIVSLRFERLDANGLPLNIFPGQRWAQFYPSLRPAKCMRVEVLGAQDFLRPPQCQNEYLATRTPSTGDDTIFWTAQDGSTQFRVLWMKEEIGRCEIEAGTCEIFAP